MFYRENSSEPFVTTIRSNRFFNLPQRYSSYLTKKINNIKYMHINLKQHQKETEPKANQDI